MTQTPSHEAALFCSYMLRSLDRLVHCLEGLSAAQLNWHPPAPNTNSLYTLAVHTINNAEENIVYTLTGRTSPRNREQEFLAHASSAQQLVAHWQDVRTRLQAVLLNLSPEALEAEYTHPRRGTITGFEVLLIVTRHAAEHLGQVELTRDLMLATIDR